MYNYISPEIWREIFYRVASLLKTMFFRIAVRNLITRLSKTNQREVLEKFIESMPQKHRNYFKPYEYLNPFHPSKIVEKVRAASEDNLVLMDSNIVEVNKAVKEVFFRFDILNLYYET